MCPCPVIYRNNQAGFLNTLLDSTGQNYSLLLTSGGLTSAITNSITVVAAAPSQLVVTTPPPATVAAGQQFGLTVAIEDQYGNVATNFSGNLAVATSDSTTEGSLGGTLTVAVGANGASPGTATFSDLSLVKAGTPFTLQVSATGLPPATTSPFTVMAAAAVQIGVVTPPPTTVAAGGPFGLTLAAEDAYGNVNSSASGSVTISLGTNPTGDTLVGATTLPLSGGLAIFSGLTLIKAGSGYVIQASSTGLTSPSASNLTFSVAAGTASQIALVSAPPATVTAGTPFTMVLAAEDQYGNVVSSLVGSVSLALGNNPGGNSLGGAASATFSNGLADFAQLTLTRVGAGYSFLAASNSMTPAPELASLKVNVVPAAASQLVVTSGPPFAVTTGQTFSLIVTAEDQYGNTATSFSGNVAIAPSNVATMGNLGGPLTAQASGGVAVFSGVSLNRSGSPFTLQISSTGLPQVVTSQFTVSTGQATQLVVIAAPSSVDVGAGFGLQVAAEDPYGNIDGSFNGPVTLSMARNPSSANLGGTLTVTAVGGVAMFSGLTLDALSAGESLAATTSGLASATTGLIDVVASGGTTTGSGSSSGGSTDTSGGSSGDTTTETGSPGSTTSGGGTPSISGPHLVISSRPATVTAGRYFQISVIAEDAQGRIESNFSGKVTVALASNPTGAVLGGTLTMPVEDGLLTFYGLTLNAAGSGYTIRASASGFNSVVSSPITVVDPPSAVGIVGPPPSSVAVRQAFGLSIAVEDAAGSVVPDYSGNVTIALVGRHGGAKLHGAHTVQAVGGVASFSGLFLTGACKGSSVAVRISADGVANGMTEVISIPAAVRPHHPAKGRARR